MTKDPHLKRYDLVTNYRCGSSIEEMKRNDEDGEWVRYEDVAPLLRTLRPYRFDCEECGQGIAVDEDGCCRSCGADADPHPQTAHEDRRKTGA